MGELAIRAIRLMNLAERATASGDSTHPSQEHVKAQGLEKSETHRICRTSLDEFKEEFLAVRVWSEHLSRELWFVSNSRAAHEYGAKGIYFTGEELAHLLKAEPTPKDLRTIVEAKEALGAQVIGMYHKENDQ